MTLLMKKDTLSEECTQVNNDIFCYDVDTVAEIARFLDMLVEKKRKMTKFAIKWPNVPPPSYH